MTEIVPVRSSDAWSNLQLDRSPTPHTQPRNAWFALWKRMPARKRTTWLTARIWPNAATTRTSDSCLT